jgi:hypothetical protein
MLMVLPPKHKRLVPGLPRLTEKSLRRRERKQAERLGAGPEGEPAIRKLETEEFPRLEQVAARHRATETAKYRKLILELTNELALRSQSSRKECETAVKEAFFWGIPEKEIRSMPLPELERLITSREKMYLQLGPGRVEHYRDVQKIKGMEARQKEMEAITRERGPEAADLIVQARFWGINARKDSPLPGLKAEIRKREEIFHSMQPHEVVGTWAEIIKRVAERARKSE